jgi:hypothetical protein
MNRRGLLKYVAWLGAANAVAPSSWAAAAAQPADDQPAEKAIVLYCDLSIDPAREQEMLHHFHHDFKPAAEKFDGYIDVKMLKIRKLLQGSPLPENVNYRFQLTYKSEEDRRRWIASDVHKKNWPLIENTFSDKRYLTLLTDNA